MLDSADLEQEKESLEAKSAPILMTIALWAACNSLLGKNRLIWR